MGRLIRNHRKKEGFLHGYESAVASSRFLGMNSVCKKDIRSLLALEGLRAHESIKGERESSLREREHYYRQCQQFSTYILQSQ
jgi:hypothetical protein